jgi:hypothetical protein
MFTKPDGEDRSSPVVNALGDAAGRVESAGGFIEQTFGVRIAGRDLAIAGMVVFFLLRGLAQSGQSLGGGIFALCFIALIGLFALAGRRDMRGTTTQIAAGPLTGLLNRLLWLAGRWWGKIVLFYALLFGWTFVMMFVSSVGALVGGAAGIGNITFLLFGIGVFATVWVVGNRVL